MAWDHLDIDKPHLAYMILGGFTSLFMLCSLFVKEKLYIGEATVATICGLIFGPHAADLFNPISWGNVDKITLECSRIVLVVQCFAVGVELPKNYMERHWRSVFCLLVPVMTYGWLMTSLFIWWMVPRLSWLEGLICAACVTATDPVLASSVVGKGKFAKRVPKHLRDLLSAESGCNDGMAFPFIYLSIYIYHYRPDANQVAFHWFCVTILYECVFGAVFGFIIGYIARHLIKFAERKSLIDRESFLVFYFVLALFCAGSGSLLGMDDLLIGFAAGVGFSNDGWFTEKTEESHVSNVIDLLLNLAYFVYFGSIIPWQQYNQAEIGLHAWRLVVISIFVILFRRIPIMLCLKPFIPDIKTWREALFAGHFGPIGVGAIFASILARAELETDSTQPLHDIPDDLEDHDIVTLIWPITTFLVITSIIIHGSSIAVFTLGKRINTLTITMSYTTADEEGPSWMNRLPRIQSQSRSSMSLRKTSLDVEGEVPPGSLPPIGVPYNMLRRQKDEESEPTDRPSARNIKRRRKRRSEGGPITQSAIAPVRAHETERDTSPVGDEEENLEKRASKSDEDDSTSHINTYREGRQILFEDEEGNVVGRTSVDEEKPEEEADYQIEDEKSSDDRHKKLSDASTAQGPGSSEETQVPPAEVKHDEGQAAEHPSTYQNLRNHFMQWGSNAFGKGKHQELHDQKRRRATEHKGPARAYQFGNTVIVEDEDGEVIKKYDIPTIPKKPGKPEEEDGGTKPPKENKAAAGGKKVVHALGRAGTWVGLKDSKGGEAQAGGKGAGEEDDNKLRFRVNHPALAGDGDGGRRMTKEDFIRQISQLDPKTRREVLNEDETPKSLVDAFFKKKNEQAASSPLARMDSPEKEDDDTPHTNIRETLKRHRGSGTAAEARRQRLSAAISPQAQSEDEEDNDDDEEAGPIPAARLHRMTGHAPLVGSSSREERPADDNEEETETPAERKRRLAALGKNSDNEQTEEELQSVDEGDETTDEEDEKEDDEAGPSTLDRIRARRGRGAVGRNLEREEDSDSEDNGEPRPVRGKVQFADGYQPRASRGPNAGAAPRTSRSGSPASPRSTSQQPHRPTISWGGERGRNQ